MEDALYSVLTARIVFNIRSAATGPEQTQLHTEYTETLTRSLDITDDSVIIDDLWMVPRDGCGHEGIQLNAV